MVRLKNVQKYYTLLFSFLFKKKTLQARPFIKPGTEEHVEYVTVRTCDTKLEKPAPAPLLKALKRQSYHIVGNHSAVKRCKWFYESLVHNRPCYKQKFYGIRSHQCIQMSPALFYCTQQCLFCWRAQNADLQIQWNELQLPPWDSPESITDGILRAQQRILTGYKGNEKTDLQKFREALTPKHVAISLTGEPTLYEPLGQLIHTLHAKGLTTFLVTNGSLPEKVAKLAEEPTQLYISLCAPNKKVYHQVCRPQIPGSWEKLNTTLGLLQSFQCPTAVRLTLVKELNMTNVEDYAKMLTKAEPTYIEAKAYMHIGFSRLRLGFDHMPSHREVHVFAEQLAECTGYKFIDESAESRVVLLSKLDKPKKFTSQ